MASGNSEESILFEHLVKLLQSISEIEPRRTDAGPSKLGATPRSQVLLTKWLSHLFTYYGGQHAIPTDTCKIFFRLFFPEEDSRRRYNLQETMLAKHLAKDVYGLPKDTGRALMEWSEYPDRMEKATMGCLGNELQKVLVTRHSVKRRQGASPSLRKVDSLLDELAFLSGFSNLGCTSTAPPRSRSRIAILRDLFRNLSPLEAKFMTQIILRDLRPVLYPVSETHTTGALLHYNTKAVHVLTKWEVMKAWHPAMPKIYRTRATFDEAAQTVGELIATQKEGKMSTIAPVLGVPIEIPKSQKGTNISHTLSFFHGENKVYAETKYDGERMQIHIDLSKDPNQQIAIFSKSKRDSTRDRKGAHAIIRAALGLLPSQRDWEQYPELFQRLGTRQNSFLKASGILDAELVPYSEEKEAIDEFWRIRSLVDSTAHGIRRARYAKARGPVVKETQIQDTQDTSYEETTQPTVESLQSNASGECERHLMVVFFDIMFLDGEPLLDRCYDDRRRLLQQTIIVIPGFSSLSHRECISLSEGQATAAHELISIFSDHIARQEEGLVLKGASSSYNDFRRPWVKVKRDYIPGYGDTVDLAIIGAGWNKARARELRVAPETFTTFFVAALDQSPSGPDVFSVPQFQILFIVEYGMDRKELENLNLYIKSWDPVKYRDELPTLSYQFQLPKGLPKPAIMFSQPLLGELFGAGFTKDQGMKHYCLRFPRLIKVHRLKDRNWTEGCCLPEFQAIARKSIGCESSDDWANRTIDEIWGLQAQPAPKDASIIKETAEEWYEKLLNLEPDIKNAILRRPSFRKRKEQPKPTTTTTTTTAKFQGTTTEPDPVPLTEPLSRSLVPPLKALGSVTNVTKTFEQRQAQEVDGLLPPPPSPPPKPISRKRRKPSMREDMQSMIPMSPGRTPTSSFIPNLNPIPVDGLPNDNILSRNRLMSPPPSSAMLVPETSEPPQEHPRRPIKSASISSSFQAICRVESVPSIARLSIPPPDWPQQYITSPIVQFMFDAYVWIQKDEDKRRPASRPAAAHLVPPNRRLAAIQPLLMICGCRVEVEGRIQSARPEDFPGINKCVIFVKKGSDSDIETKDAFNWLIEALDSWEVELKTGRNELFVFDMEMLTYNSLASFEGDVASLALWRSKQ